MEALQRLEEGEIPVVFSDIRMPGIDGLETLGAIGRINPEMTRIILTGYATMEAAIQATNRGIDGFLTKPFDNSRPVACRGLTYFKSMAKKEHCNV